MTTGGVAQQHNPTIEVAMYCRGQHMQSNANIIGCDVRVTKCAAILGKHDRVPQITECTAQMTKMRPVVCGPPETTMQRNQDGLVRRPKKKISNLIRQWSPGE